MGLFARSEIELRGRKPMIIRNESGARWLPVRIGDFDQWQVSLLEGSARRLDAVVDRPHRD
jgi:hypothetical protein